MIDDPAIPAVLRSLLQSPVISLGDYEFVESLQDYYQRFGRLSFRQNVALQQVANRDHARRAKRHARKSSK